MTLRLAITPGEPAGIGPDIVLQLAQQADEHEWVVFADAAMLAERARILKLDIKIIPVDWAASPQAKAAGELRVCDEHLAGAVVPGRLSAINARPLMKSLDHAVDRCLSGHCDALVTGPMQKSVINDAGIPFSGHTEHLMHRCDVDQVVMMLAHDDMRVVLATTHIPLRAVADAISWDLLDQVIGITLDSLRNSFGCNKPQLMVLGLNPHAGESGHLGKEERDVIEPCLNRWREKGAELIGPLPADTAFQPHLLEQCDAVLAMYHDQGLPVLKYSGFGRAVNITLGLPIVRTSVDHGTALDLAGTGRADTGSMVCAIQQAVQMAKGKRA